MFYKTQTLFIIWLMTFIGGARILAQSISSDPVSYIIEAPEIVKVGDTFTISVVFNIQPNWYVYAPIDINTARGKIPTRVVFKTSESFKKIGLLKLPDSNRFFDKYRGKDVRMSQEFQVEKNTLPDKYSIKGNLVYQTCNDDICYPPVRKTIDIEIIVN